MKIGLISTTETNIGDDLIRRGVQRILGRVLAGAPGADPLLWLVVNKHAPLEIYRPRTLAAGVAALPRGRQTAARAISRASRPVRLPSVFDDADLVVQCGTPIMWPGVRTAEWQGAFWQDVLSRPGRPPVLNLAGGSCYPWTAARPPALDPGDARALRAMFAASDVLTVRDDLAAQVARQLGADATVLPCAAVHAGGGAPAPEGAEALLLNVMPRGGHFDWGQQLDPQRWLVQMDEVVRERAAQGPLLFLCHSEAELQLARGRWPGHEALLPRTTEQYVAAARRGRIALVNRMHAAVALAGLGVPAVAIGTDTRLLMVANTGQEIGYLGDATADSMLAALATLDAERDRRRAALLARERDAFERHVAVVAASPVMGRLAGRLADAHRP